MGRPSEEFLAARDLWHFCRPSNKVTICHVTARASMLDQLRGQMSEEAWL
jgi:hypothetical protein